MSQRLGDHRRFGRVGPLRRHCFQREHGTVAQHAHLQSLAILGSRCVTRSKARRMPLAADVEPQLAAARIANGDGFENGPDAPFR
jgi:hypothetical protein